MYWLGTVVNILPKSGKTPVNRAGIDRCGIPNRLNWTLALPCMY